MPVSFVPNVACVSGLSILDCLFNFLQRLFPRHILYKIYWNINKKNDELD